MLALNEGWLWAFRLLGFKTLNEQHNADEENTHVWSLILRMRRMWIVK